MRYINHTSKYPASQVQSGGSHDCMLNQIFYLTHTHQAEPGGQGRFGLIPATLTWRVKPTLNSAFVGEKKERPPNQIILCISAFTSLDSLPMFFPVYFTLKERKTACSSKSIEFFPSLMFFHLSSDARLSFGVK